MYQSIGINLSKRSDALTRKIKVPAITQREYYKNLNTDENEEEYINFCKLTNDDACIDYDNNLKYLDDEYDDCACGEYDDEYSEESNCCKECNFFVEKIKNLDSKILIGAAIGALAGCIGISILLKRRY